MSEPEVLPALRSKLGSLVGVTEGDLTQSDAHGTHRRLFHAQPTWTEDNGSAGDKLSAYVNGKVYSVQCAIASTEVAQIRAVIDTLRELADEIESDVRALLKGFDKGAR